MPPPEAAEERLGILVVMSSEFTGLAGVGLFCHNLFTCQFLVHFEEACDDVGLEDRLGEPFEQLELLFNFRQFQQIISIHEPVEVGLEESILDDAVFLEFSFGEFFCVVCGDVASIIENGAVVAF